MLLSRGDWSQYKCESDCIGELSHAFVYGYSRHFVRPNSESNSERNSGMTKLFSQPTASAHTCFACLDSAIAADRRSFDYVRRLRLLTSLRMTIVNWSLVIGALSSWNPFINYLNLVIKLNFVILSAMPACFFVPPLLRDGGYGAEGPLCFGRACNHSGPSASFRSLRELYSPRDDNT